MLYILKVHIKNYFKNKILIDQNTINNFFFIEYALAYNHDTIKALINANQILKKFLLFSNRNFNKTIETKKIGSG